MRANLTTRDYEMLSAYIDGQLAPGEQRKLEERLHARPELQVALEELRRTRMLLRQAPRRRAPRNFTLTPAMVGEQRRKPAPWAGWFPALSFTSALAALALVVTIVLQFAPPGTTSQTIAMQPPAAMDSAPQAAPAMKKLENTAPEGAAVTQAAENPAGSAPAGAAPEGARGAASAPTAMAGPAVLPAYEATAQAFGEPTQSLAQAGQPAETPSPEIAMAAPVQETPTAESLAATAPPVIQWDNIGAGNPAMGKGGAGGLGGGGGGAEGPSLGPLMGPPPSPQAGISGLGGGAPDGNLTLPPEVMLTQTAEATPGAAGAAAATEAPATAANAYGTPVAELPAAPASGTGPILGVPGAGEGGQIVDKKAILGDTPGEAAAKPSAGATQPLVGEQPQRGPLGLQPWAMTLLQLILALLAIGAGVTAYLLRLRRNR